MATTEMAKQMAAQVQKSVAEARAKQTDLDMKLDTKVEGATLRITSFMDGDRILQAMADKLKDGLPATGALFGPRQAAAAAPKPAPQQPKKIRIYGLDDGPKEIAYPANKQ